MKKLSIIIASYNTKKLTLNAINSILKQNLTFDYEIIVVDDGSTDGSVNSIKEIKKDNPVIKILVNEKNLGYVRTNNRGIKKASGKYVLLLNSDTIVKKNSLEKLLSFAENHEDGGVIGAKLLNIDGTLQPSCYRFPTIKNAILEYWFGQKGLFEKYVPEGNKPAIVDAVVGAVFLITPKAISRVGMLNEKYRSYFEDIDYCRSVKKKGLNVYYFPEAEIIHHHGASFNQLAEEKDRWKKLIPSSKIYHGLIKHYLLTAILVVGQKWRMLLKKY